MAETTETPTRRHLRAVPETPAPAPTADQAVPTAPAEEAPLRVRRDQVHTPERERASRQVGARVRAAVATSHTFACLAWYRRWETARAYAMDPELRQDQLDTAERALDQARRAAAKKAAKALTPEDKKAAAREVERLDRRRVSELEVDARTATARVQRLARALVVPAAVVAGPVALGVGAEMWPAFAAWPAAWAWLSVQGRALARDGMATTTAADVTPTAAGTRVLHRPAAPAAAAGGAPNPAAAVVPNASAGTAEAVHGATQEEAVILDRISCWDDLAPDRGLDGLAPHAPLLDSSGICVGVSLGGKWTGDRVRGSAGRIRAMLAIPEGTGVQVTPGATGDQVVLRIRTRTPELDTRWYPGRPGIGVVPETGRVVDLDAYGHRLVAGTTGAGKSVAMRPWMASVVLNPRAALVFCDPKGQEAHLWEHCARTVKGVGGAGRDRMYRVISEVADELEWRQENAQGTDWAPSADHPELVLVVDEGAAIVRMAKLKPYRDVLDKLDYIASQGRAGRVWLHWATQYPTKTEGVPVQVTENMTKGRLALRVDSPTADRVVFGENATATGWTPSELDMPGWAMLRTENPRDVPEHIRLLYMTDEQVRALPARDPWHRPGTPDQDAEEAAGEMPEVLAAALEQMGPDAHGVRGHEIADVLGWDLVDVQAEMVDLGVRGGRFSERGVQVRGYRREDITAAAAKYRA